jgi:hypothetical protein
MPERPNANQRGKMAEPPETLSGKRACSKKQLLTGYVRTNQVFFPWRLGVFA